jgi:hypothetical protein
VVDTGEQFFGGVVDTGEKFFAFWLFTRDKDLSLVSLTPLNKVNSLSPASLTPAIKIHSRISPQIFEKIQNGPIGILGGLGDTDS